MYFQLNLLPFGLENLHIASAEAQENVSRSLKQPPTGDQMRNDWRVADVHFQALVRLLDNAVSLHGQLLYLLCI